MTELLNIIQAVVGAVLGGGGFLCGIVAAVGGFDSDSPVVGKVCWGVFAAAIVAIVVI